MKPIMDLLNNLGYADWALFVLFLSIFIDVSPIKINPIKSIFKYLGKSFNSSIEVEISDIKKEMGETFESIKKEQTRQKKALDRIILDNQDKEISRLRWEIIDFDNGIKNKVRHAPDQYRHALHSFEKYNSIMKELGTTSDEYYNEVQKHGNSIKSHYEQHSDSGEAFF